MRRLLEAALLAVVLFVVGAPSAARAYQVSPMIMDIAPSGSGASGVLRIQNTGAQPVSLEISVAKRTIDEFGRETTAPADRELFALPPQMNVAPGAVQTVRIRYAGPAAISGAQNYSALVRQLPVRREGSGVAVVVNFSVAVNVVPNGAQRVVEVVSVTRRPDGKADVVIRNAGANYVSLAATVFTFTDARGRSHVLNGQQIREAATTVLLQSGATRRLTLPLPADVAAGELKLQVVANSPIEG